MTSTAESHSQEHGHSHAHAQSGLRSYLIGFGLAVVLTAIPFYLVMTKAASPSVLLPTILLIGAVQMVVHIKYFLHLGDAANGAWNYTALGLTTLIVAIVVIGSLWVMLELNRNMMPWMFDDSGQMHMQSQTPGDAEGMVPGMKM